MKTPPILFNLEANFTVPSRPSEGCLLAYANITTSNAENVFHSTCRELVKEAGVAGTEDYQLGIRASRSYSTNTVSLMLSLPWLKTVHEKSSI